MNQNAYVIRKGNKFLKLPTGKLATPNDVSWGAKKDAWKSTSSKEWIENRMTKLKVVGYKLEEVKTEYIRL